jgi:hypothetical protein
MLLDKILNTVFSLGAAIVIFGAWGKLERTTFGDTALTAGLLTETTLFCLYGLLEWIRRPTERAQPPTTTQAASPSSVHKEDLEALTGSIKETANLLARIFRV